MVNLSATGFLSGVGIHNKLSAATKPVPRLCCAQAAGCRPVAQSDLQLVNLTCPAAQSDLQLVNLTKKYQTCSSLVASNKYSVLVYG